MKAWLKKKEDPLTERARQLNSRIAALEQEIQKLHEQSGASIQDEPEEHASGPFFRSSTRPSGSASITAESTAPAKRSEEPVFVEVDHARLKHRTEPETTPAHFNELGVRKYDLLAFGRRVRNHLRGPTTSNPKLVSYLAAGSIQGLRPLRYEKRVARNRFILLVAGLFLLLLGIVSIFMRNH